jgi:arginine decarboxylase
MKFRFPVVIIDEDYRSENASGLGIRALARRSRRRARKSWV